MTKIDAILPFGSIRKVSKSQIPNSKLETIIHIQDIHENPEAQRNIGLAVRQLIESGQVGLVALEGTSGPIDLTPFQTFPHPSIVKNVADRLLRENKISGPIHAALTVPVNVVGIDDVIHHRANIEAYRSSVPLKKSAQEELFKRKKDLAERKRAVFDGDLLAFDTKVESYRRGKLPIGDYVEFLPTFFSGEVRRGPSVTHFLEALHLEKSLNFSQVESERSHLIARLLPKLSATQTSDLQSATLAYRAGTIRHADFYEQLERLCEIKGVSLSQFPAMKNYLRCVELSDQIDAEQLLKDVRQTEKDVYAALTTSTEERNLIAESRELHLMEKLVEFALTREEWEEYKETVRRGEEFRSFEDFYKEAEIRDAKMAENLLSFVPRSSCFTLLITGGFHSSGIDDRLVKAGHTVVTFVPKITKVDTENGSAYLGVFTQEKTPLDQLFEGQKLFLAKHPMSLSARRSAVLGVASAAALAGAMSLASLSGWVGNALHWFNVSMTLAGTGVVHLAGSFLSVDGLTVPFRLALSSDGGVSILAAPLSFESFLAGGAFATAMMVPWGGSPWHVRRRMLSVQEAHALFKQIVNQKDPTEKIPGVEAFKFSAETADGHVFSATRKVSGHRAEMHLARPKPGRVEVAVHYEDGIGYVFRLTKHTPSDVAWGVLRVDASGALENVSDTYPPYIPSTLMTKIADGQVTKDEAYFLFNALIRQPDPTKRISGIKSYRFAADDVGKILFSPRYVKKGQVPLTIGGPRRGRVEVDVRYEEGIGYVYRIVKKSGRTLVSRVAYVNTRHEVEDLGPERVPLLMTALADKTKAGKRVSRNELFFLWNILVNQPDPTEKIPGVEKYWFSFPVKGSQLFSCKRKVSGREVALRIGAHNRGHVMGTVEFVQGTGYVHRLVKKTANDEYKRVVWINAQGLLEEEPLAASDPKPATIRYPEFFMADEKAENPWEQLFNAAREHDFQTLKDVLGDDFNLLLLLVSSKRSGGEEALSDFLLRVSHKILSSPLAHHVDLEGITPTVLARRLQESLFEKSEPKGTRLPFPSLLSFAFFIFATLLSFAVVISITGWIASLEGATLSVSTAMLFAVGAPAAPWRKLKFMVTDRTPSINSKLVEIFLRNRQLSGRAMLDNADFVGVGEGEFAISDRKIKTYRAHSCVLAVVHNKDRKQTLLAHFQPGNDTEKSSYTNIGDAVKTRDWKETDALRITLVGSSNYNSGTASNIAYGLREVFRLAPIQRDFQGVIDRSIVVDGSTGDILDLAYPFSDQDPRLREMVARQPSLYGLQTAPLVELSINLSNDSTGMVDWFEQNLPAAEPLNLRTFTEPFALVQPALDQQSEQAVIIQIDGALWTEDVQRRYYTLVRHAFKWKWSGKSGMRHVVFHITGSSQERMKEIWQWTRSINSANVTGLYVFDSGATHSLPHVLLAAMQGNAVPDFAKQGYRVLPATVNHVALFRSTKNWDVTTKAAFDGLPQSIITVVDHVLDVVTGELHLIQIRTRTTEPHYRELKKAA